jgi:hypothetical protein
MLPRCLSGGGVVEFYAQGATSSNASSLTVPSGSSTIPVFDPGDVQSGASVQAGVGGPTLAVTAVTASSLTVNNAGAGFSLSARTRLIPQSNRPTLYLDPLGTIPLVTSPAVFADSTGRILAYIDRSRFDYVVQGNSSTSVTVDSASSSTISGGNNATWQHTAAGDYRVALVGVSWTGVLGTETISSVTYAGIEMIPLGSSSNVSLFYLPNPPLGTQTVVVAFGASDTVYGVVGALTAKGVDFNTFSGLTNSGSGTSASLSFPASATTSRLFGVLGIGNQSTPVTVSPGSGQANHWNASQGTSPFYTNGMGSSKAGLTSPTTLTFTWGPSRNWGVAGVELRYLGGTPAARLYADAQGVLFNPVRLNARDFVSIQAAIDALPATGGIVYLPAGVYTVTSTIVVPFGKPVQLIGDGRDHTRIECALPNVDILWIQSSLSLVQDLTIKGPFLVPTSGGRGIVIGNPNATDPFDFTGGVSLIRVRITETSSWALFLMGPDDGGGAFSYVLGGLYDRCEFTRNKTAGLVSVRKGCYVQTFSYCLFDAFLGTGLEAYATASVVCDQTTFENKENDVSPYVILDGVANATFRTCWFEQHHESDLNQPFIQVGLGSPCQDVTVADCRFVRNSGDLPRMVRVDNESKSVSIVNPVCLMVSAPLSFDQRLALPDADKDLAIVGPKCELVLSGGIVMSGALGEPPALVIASSTGVDIAGTGPRISPAKLTDALRDDPNSLARDKKPGDLIYNSDLGRLQSWTGADWVPVRKSAGGTSSASGPLLSAAGAYHVSAYLTLSSTGSGTVSVSVSWMEGVVQRTVNVLPAFSTAGGAASGVAYIVAAGPVTYSVSASGFFGGGSYSVEIRAEAV